MQPLFVKTAESKLEYYVFNSLADNPILCFHGFDQSGEVFHELAQQNPKRKIIGVSLFGHGGSEHKLTHIPVQPKEFIFLIEQIVDREQIEQFDVSGYSLGGRYALTTNQFFNKRIGNVYLLAPDGLVKNFWFTLATMNKVQRRLFYSTMKSIKKLCWVIDLLQKIGVVDSSTAKFVRSQLQKPLIGIKVYTSWVACCRFHTSSKELSQISLKSASIHFILAKNDPLIHENSLLKIAKQVPNSSVVIINKSHLALGYINFLQPAD